MRFDSSVTRQIVLCGNWQPWWTCIYWIMWIHDSEALFQIFVRIQFVLGMRESTFLDWIEKKFWISIWTSIFHSRSQEFSDRCFFLHASVMRDQYHNCPNGRWVFSPLWVRTSCHHEFELYMQWKLYLSFPDNSFSRIRRSISMVPEWILFQLWLPHLLLSRIHCFFFRPPTETMNRGFTVYLRCFNPF
jgi:hypothetical protein